MPNSTSAAPYIFYLRPATCICWDSSANETTFTPHYRATVGKALFKLHVCCFLSDNHKQTNKTSSAVAVATAAVTSYCQQANLPFNTQTWH
jgi:hypothetical protein